MSIQLPAPIDHYIRIENSGDVEALSQCFAADAVVHDEGRTYERLDAIKNWTAATKKKYGHTVTPLEVADRNGKVVLNVRLSGDFPGSPVTVALSFVLEHGRIASLRIG
jgi:SnoaL-like domain